MASNMGMSDFPRSVRLYSTFGGICGYSFLFTNWSASNSFNVELSVLKEISPIYFFISLKRTMPVYWYSIPAQIKGVIDRIFSFVIGGKDIAGKECALITCCEEEDMSVMDGVRIPMERMCALNKWKMVGEVLIPGVLNVGDIDKTDGCKRAAALADAI